jgi:hypothetical protein
MAQLEHTPQFVLLEESIQKNSLNRYNGAERKPKPFRMMAFAACPRLTCSWGWVPSFWSISLPDQSHL